MKNRKSKLYASLQSIAIIFAMFFVMAFACGDDTQTDSDTRTGGNLPVIPGTAWKIDWKRSGPVQTYLFCKSGRWEVISSQFLNREDIPDIRGIEGGAVTFMGTYTVKGDTLVSKMDNGPTDTYKMKWDGSVLELIYADSGETALRLYERSETACK